MCYIPWPVSCAVILHHSVVLIHDLSLQTHKAKSASTLEKIRIRREAELWQDLKGYEVQIKNKCSVSYLKYSMEVSQRSCVTLPSTITYSSSEVPDMWLCKSSLLPSCLSLQYFLSFSPLLIFKNPSP